MPSQPPTEVPAPELDQLRQDARLIRAATRAAHRDLVERELLVEAVALCAVAGEHVLVVGPPGTAKSHAVRAVATRLGGRYFEYLLGRFSEPSELFGPLDLRSLRDGIVAVETTGMLPEADIAFLDEVFLGSTAILNTLLGLLNERVYRRGSTQIQVPLRVCVAATNTLPEDPALAAFADRFLARVFLEPVPDALLEDLLVVPGVTRGSPAETGSPNGDLAALDRLTAVVPQVALDEVRPSLATAIRRLRAAGIALTDRRIVRTTRLIAAAAVLDGRLQAASDDLWVLPLVAPTLAAQRISQEVLADVMSQARSATLPHAAEQLARGRAGRAQRLLTAADDLLDELTGHRVGGEARLRVEALLREIDASFALDDLPEPLAAARRRLIGLLPAAP